MGFTSNFAVLVLTYSTCLGSSALSLSMIKSFAVISGTHLAVNRYLAFSTDAPPNASMIICLNFTSLLLGSSYANGRELPIFVRVLLAVRYAVMPLSRLPQTAKAIFTKLLFLRLCLPYITGMAALPQRLWTDS